MIRDDQQQLWYFVTVGRDFGLFDGWLATIGGGLGTFLIAYSILRALRG
ncbi:MAG: hypothetical protein Fur005_49600 [Roseiflexaceae bacterium]